MNSNAPTIREVAARAGCSIATVSRVATGSGPVSEDMRRRVVEASVSLGFRMDRERGARPTIGVLMPSLANPVFAAALAGIEQCARSQKLSTIVAQSHYDARDEERAVAALIAERPRGLILTVCAPSTCVALTSIIAQGIPAVTIYNADTPAALGAVLVDNRKAMAAVAGALTALGHRRILFVGGSFASSDRSAARYAGYCEALTACGADPLPPLEVDFIDAESDIDLSVAIERFRPTAITASNDLLAVTVIASLRRMGLSVPRHISVTGFDGIEIARLMAPKLTTVAQPSRTMGLLAAAMLLDIAAGRRKPTHLTAEANFLVGETTAPPSPRGDTAPLYPQPILALGA
jgi:DNA-binding LacI/PurR family transcriptional regulator